MLTVNQTSQFRAGQVYKRSVNKPVSTLQRDNLDLSTKKMTSNNTLLAFGKLLKDLVSFTSLQTGKISFETRDDLTQLQKSTIQAIVNIFETGKPLGDYGKVTLIKGDPGHLTYGRSQTTLTSGNLYLLIKAYCEKNNSQYGKQLEKFLDRLSKKDLSLDHNEELKDLLRKAGKDTVMQQTQDEFFDRIYFNNALNRAKTLGLTTPLGIAVVYDSYIHGSFNTVYKLTNNKLGKTPEQAGEKEWIKAYVDTRYDWLANHSKVVLHKTVYRMNSFKSLIAKNNWELSLPLTVHGRTISEDTFKTGQNKPDPQPVPDIPDTPSAEEKNRPILRLIKDGPYMKNNHVLAVQKALKARSYDLTCDSVYGPQTESVVKKFQKDNNLKPDGIVGKLTYEALRIGSENKFYPLIKLTNPYQEGEHIKEIQQILSNKGYQISIDGTYGPESEAIVRQFQKDSGLKVDGVVGQQTYQKLGVM